MKQIDLESWPRRAHYELFRSMGRPQYAVTVSVPCPGLRDQARKRDLALGLLVTHAICSAANKVPELKQRIRGNQVVEHSLIHPSMTTPSTKGLFSFCPMVYHENRGVFAQENAAVLERAKRNPDVDVNHEEDDRIFISALPWFAFTSLSHPIIDQDDCIPRVAWGRISDQADPPQVPVNIQVHHGLVDGVHLAQFFESLELALNQEALLT